MRYLLLCLAAICSYAAVAQLSPEELRKHASEARHQARVQEREIKTAEFKQHMDSIVLTHSYRFLPSTYALQPAGVTRMIYNPNFQLGVYPDFMDIYLPYLKGITPPYIVTILNYTITNPNNYIAKQTNEGWTISFNSSLFSANTYTFTLNIYGTTGEAILNISSEMYNTVTYNGTIMGNY